VLNPGKKKSTQDYIVFTYDDFQSGQKNPPYPKAPNHIVSIREGRWKLAKYYGTGEESSVPVQWEMYDLKRDPLEKHNIAHEGAKRTPLQEKELQRLKAKLAKVEKTRLRPPKGA
jgi:arylsulfatase A-like enzyme